MKATTVPRLLFHASLRRFPRILAGCKWISVTMTSVSTTSLSGFTRCGKVQPEKVQLGKVQLGKVQPEKMQLGLKIPIFLHTCISGSLTRILLLHTEILTTFLTYAGRPSW